MTSGKWSESGVPHRGWSCIDIHDEGEPCHTCEMCETTLVRYVHVMEHPEYPDTLSVGCICAGNMEQDYAAAQEREKQFKWFRDLFGSKVSETGRETARTFAAAFSRRP